jgi:hypothetical protein
MNKESSGEGQIGRTTGELESVCQIVIFPRGANSKVYGFGLAKLYGQLGVVFGFSYTYP